ncbi:MAG: PASTA domain-containing protein [Candidatus Hydrogenedentes bacterium]|nr:PASTA domain-containing protein [Candidatus Hydrogenedentota bacterium]
MGRILLDTVSETILNFVFFILKFVSWGIQWVAALAVFLVVMAAAGYYVYVKTLDGGEPVQVPNIVGLPVQEAMTRLAERGLEMGRQQQVPHETTPEYHIISQRPASGRVVRTGRKVYPTVSMGPDFLTAPSLVKRSLKAAQAELANSRFKIGSVSRIPHTSPRNTVIAQDPPPGHSIAIQGSVHLLVSEGDTQYNDYMPDLLGKSVRDIERILAPYHVTLIPEVVRELVNAREDVVLEQDPLPTTMIFEGQIVTYKVKPSGRITLPDTRLTGAVRHVMNYSWYDRDVRIEQIDQLGNRTVIGSYPPALDEKSKAARVSGSTLAIPVTYIGACTVEIYVNGNRIAAYQLTDGNAPRNITPSI